MKTYQIIVSRVLLLMIQTQKMMSYLLKPELILVLIGRGKTNKFLKKNNLFTILF